MENVTASPQTERSFRRRLVFIASFPLLVLALLAALSVWQLKGLLQASQGVQHSDRVIADLTHLQKLFLDVETGMRGYLITRDEELLESYTKGSLQIDPKMNEIHSMVADNPTELQKIEELENIKNEWMDNVEKTIQMRKKGISPVKALNQASGDRVMGAIRLHIDQLLAAEETLRDARNSKAQDAASYFVSFLIALGLIGGVFLAFFMRLQMLRLSRSYERTLLAFEEQSHTLQESQERFYTTLKSIGDGVIATDAYGLVTFMNPLAEKMTGWRLNQATGKRLGEVFHIINETTRENISNPIDRVMCENIVVGLSNHTALVGRNGEEYIIEDNAAPIRNEQGRLLGAVLVFRDSTEKNRSTERRQFLARVNSILMSSLDYSETLQKIAELSIKKLADWCAIDIVGEDKNLHRVVVTHRDPGKVTWAKELQKRFPNDASSASGVATVLRSGKSELFKDIGEKALAAGVKSEEHLRMRKELGVRSAMIVPLTAHGKTFGTITFATENLARSYNDEDLLFAEELARHAALAVDNAKLYLESQKSNRIKDEFLATLSHELRTPLNVIQGWILLLENERRESPTFQSGFETLKRNAHLLGEIINNLLDVSRIIRGTVKIDVDDFNFAEVIESAVESLKFAAKAKSVGVNLNLNPMASYISGDSARLQQVVWNLVSNAIKFTPRGGAIDISLERVDANVELTVKDSGQGIDPKFLPYVFDRFRQEDSSTTRVHGGLGLGLAIVRQLVELHGGTIKAFSEGPDQGSTFKIILPIFAAKEAAGPREERSKLEPVPAVPVGAAALDGVKLLVVEDSEDSRLLIQRILEDAGAKVVATDSAEEALKALESYRPDIILSDIGMPGENGYSMMKKIRSLSKEKGGQTPAVALTAYARDEERKMALAAGYQIHVAKPVHPETLIWAVTRLLPNTPQNHRPHPHTDVAS